MARGLIKRSVLKAGLLIAPKEHWPPFDGGLSMELAGVTPGGHQLFKYTHSATYHVSIPSTPLSTNSPKLVNLCCQAAVGEAQRPRLLCVSSRLLPYEAPDMIAEKRKPFCLIVSTRRLVSIAVASVKHTSLKAVGSDVSKLYLSP